METCSICFKEVRKLPQHMKSVHEERKFHCTFVENGQQCTKKYASEPELKQHVEISHCGVRKYACEQCNSSFSCKSDLRGHVLNIHERKKIQCEICPTLMGSKNYYSKHIKSHHRDIDPTFKEALLKKIRETPEEELFNYQK
jgi:KRAB domain-containing zinc finger protein